MKTVQNILLIFGIIGSVGCGSRITDATIETRSYTSRVEDSESSKSSETSSEDIYVFNEVDYILFAVDISIVLVVVIYTNSYVKLMRWNNNVRKNNEKQKKINQERIDKYPFD